jgi:hypothetical protein
MLSEAGFGVVNHVGAAATEAAFRKAASPSVLHIATHGFLTATASVGSKGSRGMMVKGVGSAPSPSAQPSSPKETVKRVTNEANRTVLAFAGAQESLSLWLEGRYPEPAADGILTPAEVAAMDFDGTWLVVLSACQSGQGDDVGGEGVFGLRRAFKLAGAQNLVITLWPVADETTFEMMKDFYREALPNGDVAEAMARIQASWLLKLRSERGLAAAVREAGPFVAAAMANAKASGPTAQPASKAPTAEDKIRRLEQNAELGDSAAMSALGFLYAKGAGVPKDRAKALKWYRSAFKAGNSDAFSGLEALSVPDNLPVSPGAQKMRDLFKGEE